MGGGACVGGGGGWGVDVFVWPSVHNVNIYIILTCIGGRWCGGGRVRGGGGGGRRWGGGSSCGPVYYAPSANPSGGWIPEIAAAPIMLTRVRYVHRLRGELSCGQKGEKTGSHHHRQRLA